MRKTNKQNTMTNEEQKRTLVKYDDPISDLIDSMGLLMVAIEYKIPGEKVVQAYASYRILLNPCFYEDPDSFPSTKSDLEHILGKDCVQNFLKEIGNKKIIIKHKTQ